MKDFSKNKKAANSYPQQFATLFSADNEIAGFLQNPNTLQAITARLESIQQSHPDNENAQRLTQRIESLGTMFTALKNSINPERTEIERQKSTANFISAINGVTGKIGNSFGETSFREDIAELLNAVGHEMQADPFFQLLSKIETTCSDVQDLSSDLLAKDRVNEINTAFRDNTNAWETLQQDRDTAISAMYKINPDLKASEIDAVVVRKRKVAEKAQDEWDNFNSPGAVEGRNKARIAATTKLNQFRQQLEEESKIIKTNKDQAEYIKNGNEYSLDRLPEIDADWTENDKRNELARAEIELREKELDEVTNSRKKLNAAEKKVQNAVAERDKALANIDKENNYKDWLRIKNYADNSFVAKSLIPQLVKAQNDNLLFSALYENGIISGLPGQAAKQKAPVKNDGAYLTREYLEKKDIAEKYVTMRNAIIEASKASNQNTKGKTEAELFFENLEKGKDQYRPMQLIEEKFLKKCSDTYDAAVGSMQVIVKNNLDIFGDEDVISLQDKVNTAEDEYKALKNRLEASRKPKDIEADIKEAKEGIAKREADKLDDSNEILKTFGEEPKDKPLTIGELGAIGTKKAADLLSEIEELDSSDHKLKNGLELNTLQGEVRKKSVEEENRVKDELSDKLENANKEKESAIKLKNICDSLYERHNSIADKQSQLKEKTANATHHIPLDNTADSLAAIGAHIGDATRLVSHTNSPEFNKMTGAIVTAVNAIRDPAVQDDERLRNIEQLNKAAKEYLDAKKAQTFVLGTAMRKSRIDYATQIFNITNKALTRGTELLSGNEWQTAQRNLTQKKIDHKSEVQFKSEFEKSQETYKQQVKAEQLQNNNKAVNAPGLGK